MLLIVHRSAGLGFQVFGRAHMVSTAHGPTIPGCIGTLQLFLVLLIVFFTAFLATGKIIKTCCRFLCPRIITVSLTVSAEFVSLICVFIFIKTAALTVEALALTLSLALTVASVEPALTVKALTLTLPLALTVASVKPALTVKALTL